MFRNYNEAYNAAVLKARELVSLGLAPEQAEQGLEFNDLFKTYSFRTLPLACNRDGHERSCEVVKPSDPLVR
jgi:hypothetical protein